MSPLKESFEVWAEGVERGVREKCAALGIPDPPFSIIPPADNLTENAVNARADIREMYDRGVPVKLAVVIGLTALTTAMHGH